MLPESRSSGGTGARPGEGMRHTCPRQASSRDAPGTPPAAPGTSPVSPPTADSTGTLGGRGAVLPSSPKRHPLRPGSEPGPDSGGVLALSSITWGGGTEEGGTPHFTLRSHAASPQTRGAPSQTERAPSQAARSGASPTRTAPSGRPGAQTRALGRRSALKPYSPGVWTCSARSGSCSLLVSGRCPPGPALSACLCHLAAPSRGGPLPVDREARSRSCFGGGRLVSRTLCSPHGVPLRLPTGRRKSPTSGQ